MKPCGRTRAVSTDSTEGPLGMYIPGFGELLANQGYARSTAREKIRLITNLDHWLQRRSIDVSTLDEKHAMRFLSQRQICHPSRRGDPATVRALFRYLRGAGIVATPVLKVNRAPSIAYSQPLR